MFPNVRDFLGHKPCSMIDVIPSPSQAAEAQVKGVANTNAILSWL